MPVETNSPVRHLRQKWSTTTPAQQAARKANWKIYRLRGVYATLESLFLDGHMSLKEFTAAVDALISAKGDVAPTNARPFARELRMNARGKFRWNPEVEIVP